VPSSYRKQIGPLKRHGMKGVDYQLIDLFCLVTLAKAISKHRGLRALLLRYAFILRVLYCPEEEYRRVKAAINLNDVRSKIHPL